jgi:hypothetical protein
MTAAYDVAGIGNAIVDIIAPATEAFLEGEGLIKGSMILIDEARATALYEHMAAAIEASGGSAANSLAGLCSFGGTAAFMGKVADDQLGRVFHHDIKAIGVDFRSAPLRGGAATGQCLINVTDDGQRTMTTFLGAAALLSPEDVDPGLIAASEVVYLEGYLFDPPAGARGPAEGGAAGAGGRPQGGPDPVRRLCGRALARRPRGRSSRPTWTCCSPTSTRSRPCSAPTSTPPSAELGSRTALAAGHSRTAGLGDPQRRPGDRDLRRSRSTRWSTPPGAGDQYAPGFLYGLSHGGRWPSAAASARSPRGGHRPLGSRVRRSRWPSSPAAGASRP